MILNGHLFIYNKHIYFFGKPINHGGCSYFNPLPPLKEYQWLEFYAGYGNLTRFMKASGYKSARFELGDADRQPHRRSNYMDILSPSGFWFLSCIKRCSCG
jgi:hypothetical protein